MANLQNVLRFIITNLLHKLLKSRPLTKRRKAQMLQWRWDRLRMNGGERKDTAVSPFVLQPDRTKRSTNNNKQSAQRKDQRTIHPTSPWNKAHREDEDGKMLLSLCVVVDLLCDCSLWLSGYLRPIYPRAVQSPEEAKLPDNSASRASMHVL